ncbi:MAG TPA: glycosyltransferase family 2 protein [Acidimicrobiia bacterium]|nr:glycosyltransferase family 2 protein [Acidimicrobiia bacterium]
MTRLSVVVVNWNGVELLPGCLDPLVGTDHEVIVVDNGSVDESVAVLRERYPAVALIENSENLGFAVANNQGLRAATGDHILLLNSDTVPDLRALDALVEFLDDHPRVGVVGPTLVNPDGTPQSSCGPGPNLWTEFLAKTMIHRLLPGLRARAPRESRQVDWVTGAALCIRRDLAVPLGGLDEEIFMFYEDLDLCARVREAGHQVWFVATPPVIHIGGASRRKVEAETLVHSYRGTDRFFGRHGPPWRRRVVRGLTLAEMVWRSALWAIISLVPKRRSLARERLRAYRAIFGLARRG